MRPRYSPGNSITVVKAACCADYGNLVQRKYALRERLQGLNVLSKVHTEIENYSLDTYNR